MAGSNGKESFIEKFKNAIVDIVANVPDSTEVERQPPEQRARQIIRNAQLKAAGCAGSLALPPGPLAWLTILPDLIAIWRIQAQMVSDIAAVYGQKAQLTQEMMLYCLFKHAASQAFRDIITRVGQRLLVRKASLSALRSILAKIGIRVSQRVLGRGITRAIPLVGAGIVAWYAYYDTGQVGKTALSIFSAEIEIVRK